MFRSKIYLLKIAKFISMLCASLSLLVLFVFMSPTYGVSDKLSTNNNNNNNNKAKLRSHYYLVKIGSKLTLAQVKICFDGKAPDYLAVDYKKATKQLVNFPQTQQGYIEFEGRYWKTKNLAANACIEYSSDISSHLYKSNKLATEQRDLTLSFQNDNTWLWLPEVLGPDESAIVEFDLPNNYQVSAPWLQIDQRNNIYQIGRTPHDWGFSLMIGEFEKRQFKLAEAQINLSMLPQLNNKDLLVEWVIHSIDSLKSYLGKMPVNHLQVILLENKHFKKGPVPWGDVKRGGGMGVRFVVNSQRDINQFYQDWTASHEFSHLLAPNLQRRDLWMSEGLASYLQYILMARSGRLSENQLWQNLYAGLKRGEKGARNLSSETLAETVSHRKQSGRNDRTMRIYWSGAVYFLLADIQLRKNNQGKYGLNKVLAGFNTCCSQTNQEWQGIEFAEKLDVISNTKIFSQLYYDVFNSRGFPDIDSIFDELAIDIINDKVRLQDNKGQQAKAIRRSIIFE